MSGEVTSFTAHLLPNEEDYNIEQIGVGEDLIDWHPISRRSTFKEALIERPSDGKLLDRLLFQLISLTSISNPRELELTF